MKRNSNGSVLFSLTVCMMILVNITAVTYFYASQSRARMARQHIDMEKAVYCAEAGVERAVAYLMNGGTGTNLSGSINGGTYTITILEKSN